MDIFDIQFGPVMCVCSEQMARIRPIKNDQQNTLYEMQRPITLASTTRFLYESIRIRKFLF